MNSFDFFISHAGADKAKYIEPLVRALSQKGLSFWLDSLEVGWGNNVSMSLSEGLRSSRFVLLCLSRNFLRRPWPETELGAALAVQNDGGVRCVLPLILNSRKEVLAQYPILAGLAYREFKIGVDRLSDELVKLKQEVATESQIIVVAIESMHTGQICNILVDPKASVRWLADKAQASLGISTQAETGAYLPFIVRWVLVDTKAEERWRKLPRSKKRRMHALIMSSNGLSISFSGTDRLDSLGIHDGVTFHLYAVEDEAYTLAPDGGAFI